MSSTPEGQVRSCTGCGASIYPEHILRGLAGHWGGQLLCPHCLAERKQADTGDQASLSLVDEDDHVAASNRSTTTDQPAMTDTTAELAAGIERRPLNKTGQGATRVRIFHARLSDGAVRNMNLQVNQWLDRHPDIEIKFANTSVGTWEGKHAEPNLILTLFY